MLHMNTKLLCELKTTRFCVTCAFWHKTTVLIWTQANQTQNSNNLCGGSLCILEKNVFSLICMSHVRSL
jgi:hypothetical protein